MTLETWFILVVLLERGLYGFCQNKAEKFLEEESSKKKKKKVFGRRSYNIFELAYR